VIRNAALNFASLGTVDTWSQGAPRYTIVRTKTHGGHFALALDPSSVGRSQLRFSLMRSIDGRNWKVIHKNLGPAFQDPVMVSDFQGRLHIFYPILIGGSSCRRFGNIAHMILDPRRAFQIQWIDTSKVFADHGNEPVCTERYSATVHFHRDDQAIYLAFRVLPNRFFRSQFAFARFDLAANNGRGAWEKRVVVETSVDKSSNTKAGVGYSVIAPGRRARELVLLHTVWDGGQGYREVVLTVANGADPRNFKSWPLCDTAGSLKPVPPGVYACLGTDLVVDPDGWAYALYSAAPGYGARPGKGLGVKSFPRFGVYLAKFQNGLRPLIVQDGNRSPDTGGALARLGRRLMVVAAYPYPAPNSIGFWESSDQGVSWRFREPVDTIGGPDRPYQPLTMKKHWSGTVTESEVSGAVRGMVTNFTMRNPPRFTLGAFNWQEFGNG